MTWATQVLGKYIHKLQAEEIPSSTLEMAKSTVLDLCGAAICGYFTSAAKVIRNISINGPHAFGPSVAGATTIAFLPFNFPFAT